jgi:hypothetical protein
MATFTQKRSKVLKSKSKLPAVKEAQANPDKEYLIHAAFEQINTTTGAKKKATKVPAKTAKKKATKAKAKS